MSSNDDSPPNKTGKYLNEFVTNPQFTNALQDNASKWIQNPSKQNLHYLSC